MARVKAAFHSGPDEQFHAEFTAVIPGQLDVEMVDDFSSSIVGVEFVDVRENFEWPMDQRFAESRGRFENIVTKAEDDRQETKQRDFRPGLAANANIGAVAQHANVLFSDVQERQATGIAKKREHYIAMGIDGLTEDEFHAPVIGCIPDAQRVNQILKIQSILK